MLKEETRCAEAVYDIVQRFISDIGIPTIERYERCANNIWKLPKSAQRPQPLSQHGILPKAWPPNSSCFNYHGRKPVTITGEDDDHNIITPFQHELISCLEKEAFLKAELMLAKNRIEDLETDLAVSRQREQELLVQIAHLTTATPNLHRSLAFNQKSPQIQNIPPHASPVAQVPTENGTFFEGHNLDDMFHVRHLTNAVATPATPHTPNRHRTPAFSQKSPQVHSPLCHKTFSLAPTARTFSPAPTATTELGTFIESHNLDDIFPAIDLVRRKVAMYLWQDELLNAGVPENLLPQLMAVMSSPSSSTTFV